MAELNLLPAKEFEITLKSGKIVKGKFSLWASKRYADKKGYSLQKLVDQAADGSVSLDDICIILLCAVEHSSRMNKEGFAYTDMDACEWIEEMGGLLGEQFTMLVNHAKDEPVDSPADDEKKSP